MQNPDNYSSADKDASLLQRYACWQFKWLTNLPKEGASFIFGFRQNKWRNVQFGSADVRTALIQHVGNYLPLGSQYSVTLESSTISSYVA
jgi:hypothetical protein